MHGSLIKMQAECIKSNVYVHILAEVFFGDILEIFKNTFENINSLVEYLQTAAPAKCYLSNVNFVIISYHSYL